MHVKYGTCKQKGRGQTSDETTYQRGFLQKDLRLKSVTGQIQIELVYRPTLNFRALLLSEA